MKDKKDGKRSNASGLQALISSFAEHRSMALSFTFVFTEHIENIKKEYGSSDVAYYVHRLYKDLFLK